MEEWKEYKLGEFATFKTGKLNSNAAVENGCYPFFTCSPETLRINDYAFDQKAILLAGNNAEGNFNIKYYEGKFNAYQRTYVINPIDKRLDIKFLYYALSICLQSFKRHRCWCNHAFNKHRFIVSITYYITISFHPTNNR